MGYFTHSLDHLECKSIEQIEKEGGMVVENADGTVSVYEKSSGEVMDSTLHPTVLSKQCCEALKSTYTFDINNQKCIWGEACDTDTIKPFKLVLNPVENTGVVFSVDKDSDEKCILDVSFDYLFQFSCNELYSEFLSNQESESVSQCSSVKGMLETLNVYLTLEMVNTTQKLETVYQEKLFNIGSGQLYSHLNSNSPNSGLRLTGDTNTEYCDIIKTQITNDIIKENPTLNSTDVSTLLDNSFDSNWLHASTTITDPTVINKITDKEIKVSLKVTNYCGDFSILVDRIKMFRHCSKLDSTTMDISKSPTFDLIRVSDNKKSWLTNEDLQNREFDLRFRGTQYDINNYKLAINSKEVDLDVNPANAIEQDVYCYVKDNDCILDCITATTFSCPDGYEFNETETECVQISTTASTENGNFLSGVTGDKLSVFDRFGVVFLGDVYDKTFPLEFSGSTGVTGSYSGTNFVVDGNGEVLNALYGGPGTGSTYYGPASILNSLWGQGTSSSGRMNNAGIKASPATVNEWLGFSYCVDVPFDGIYQVGLGADDKFRFKLNGDSVFEQINATGGILPPYPPYSLYINHFWVFGLELKAGKNIIEVEYMNTVGGSPENLTAEIYTATTEELVSMTTKSELSAVTIFSTADFLGEDFQLGVNSGYSCPDGYALDTCVPPPYQCSKINRSSITEESDCLSCESTLACPTGYDLSPDSDACRLTETSSASSGTIVTATTLSSGDKNSVFGSSGLRIYDNIDNLTMPISNTISSINTYSDDNGTGKLVPVLYNSVKNSLWGNGSKSTGRLNNAGIWRSDGLSPVGDYVGFAHCLDISEGGTYYVGLAADNWCRFLVNGELIIDFNKNSTRNFNWWHVFPVKLKSGLNIIEMEGAEGTSSGSTTAFGAEIYNATAEELVAMTSESQLSGVTVFSTKDYNTQEFQIGDSTGYFCPTGYALNTCSTPYECVKITIADVETSENCCGGDGIDISLMITTDLSGVTSLNEFKKVLYSELIDVKNRKTLSSYPTLKLLYERYLNSTVWCDNESSSFQYLDMHRFSELVGTYWVDLIEQVVPTTTIWGSTYVYGNTIFDQQKYKYRKYSLFSCDEPNFNGDLVSPTDGEEEHIEVIKTTTETTEEGLIITKVEECEGLYIKQINCGCEFVGRVIDLNNEGNDGEVIVINEE